MNGGTITRNRKIDFGSVFLKQKETMLDMHTYCGENVVYNW